MKPSDSSAAGPVQSWNEWDPLEEVIVGTARHARLPYHDDGMNHLEPETRDSLPDPARRRYPEAMLAETEEDIARFCEALESLGVVVRQAEPIAFEGRLVTPDWESDYYFQYPPRDILLAYGDQLIEAPCPFRSRQFEIHAYRHILADYLRRGARWVAAPRPMLRDEIYVTDADGDAVLGESEPVFDAANILRAGRDVIYLHSCSGNLLGAQWLRQTLGDGVRVHVLEGMYKGTHLDTTIALLRPGLLLANPERVTRDRLPEPFCRWDIIMAPEMDPGPQSPFAPISSKWLGMNLLMLRPDLAVVDRQQPGLIRLLEAHGIECMPLVLRHGRQLAGGFHCITVDVRRRGSLEDYR